MFTALGKWGYSYISQLWPTYSIGVIVEGKSKEREGKPHKKEMGYRVFYDVNKIGRPKAVTSIPILLRHYRQLQ